jgi:hypothetical protein
MEMALRRLDGVDQVAISLQQQTFVVLYEPDSSFQPDDLREAASLAGVNVVQFHIQAKGKIQKQGDQLIFVSGRNRYEPVDSPEMPLDTALRVGGDILDDSKVPFQLKVLDFKLEQ